METQTRTRKGNGEVMAQADEIGTPTTGGADITSVSFSKRLRSTLESLQDNQHIDIRTQAERQQVSNIVGQVQKKLNVKFETVVLRKRSEDPEGKIAIRIKRMGLLETKLLQPSQ